MIQKLYKLRVLDDLKSVSESAESSEVKQTRRHSISECMERLELEEEIKYYERKLKHIEWEYNNSMTMEWPKIREKEVYFIRAIARLKTFRKMLSKIQAAQIYLKKSKSKKKS